MSGVVPDMILFGGPVLQDRLLASIKDAWNEGNQYQRKLDYAIISVALACLMYVVGKVFTRID